MAPLTSDSPSPSRSATPAPRPTTTVLATVWPAAKFTNEVGGRPPPASPTVVSASGHTVRKPSADGWVTVTFRATAPTTPRGSDASASILAR